jgi:TRAP-type mannitol/chloroaromatic compound transport system substrate-binding protein
MMRSLVLQDSPLLLLSGLVGGQRNAHTLISLEKWESLPKNYQAAILAAREAADDKQI